MLKDEFEKLATDDMLKEPIQTELNILRTQQEKLRIFHERLRPINRNYAIVLEICDKLIKSADEEVSTTALVKPFINYNIDRQQIIYVVIKNCVDQLYPQDTSVI